MDPGSGPKALTFDFVLISKVFMTRPWAPASNPNAAKKCSYLACWFQALVKGFSNSRSVLLVQVFMTRPGAPSPGPEVLECDGWAVGLLLRF